MKFTRGRHDVTLKARLIKRPVQRETYADRQPLVAIRKPDGKQLRYVAACATADCTRLPSLFSGFCLTLHEVGIATDSSVR